VIFFSQNNTYGELISGYSAVTDPAETDFGDFSIEYLGEYEAICEAVVDC
jgi:hypothetical protein